MDGSTALHTTWTGQDRTTKKSQKRNISHIWEKAPRKDIAMKFGTGVDVLVTNGGVKSAQTPPCDILLPSGVINDDRG